ncbi:hypothetical protein KA977_13065, partial [Candidatus Dependentiae bacterium]|nr:hypothetical protein [Candidatus Dependentiae bacterium]
VLSGIGIEMEDYQEYAGMRTDEVFYSELIKNKYCDCSETNIRNLTKKKGILPMQCLKKIYVLLTEQKK